MEILLVAVVIAVFVLLIPLGIAQSRQTNEAWAAAARQLGLNYRPSSFLQSRQITGLLHNYSITVDTYTVRSNKSSTTYTRFRLSYPSLGLGLRMSQEGFLTGLTKFFGAQDIQVGDAAFDGDMLIKGANPQRVREFLTPARRMRIHRFFRSHSGAEIDDREMQWRTRGVIRDTSRLVTVVRSLMRLAWHLTGDREDDEILGQALNAQDEGRPDAALAFLQNLETRSGAKPDSGEALDRAEPVEEHLLKGELLYMADRRDEAKQAFQMARQAEPDDPDLVNWADHVEEVPAVSPPSKPEVEQGIDIASICQELFDRDKMSYEISRQFEQQFEGRAICWSGLLRRVEAFAFELVFGNEPGCKAVITVHELPSTTYGDQRVSAIVHFPKEDLERLREWEGQTVTFEGRLKKVDALLRNFYITGGQLRAPA